MITIDQLMQGIVLCKSIGSNVCKQHQISFYVFNLLQQQVSYVKALDVMIPPRRSLLCLNYYSRLLLFSRRRTDMCAPSRKVYTSIMQNLFVASGRRQKSMFHSVQLVYMLFSWRRTYMLSEFCNCCNSFNTIGIYARLVSPLHHKWFDLKTTIGPIIYYIQNSDLRISPESIKFLRSQMANQNLRTIKLNSTSSNHRVEELRPVVAHTYTRLHQYSLFS